MNVITNYQLKMFNYRVNNKSLQTNLSFGRKKYVLPKTLLYTSAMVSSLAAISAKPNYKQKTYDKNVKLVDIACRFHKNNEKDMRFFLHEITHTPEAAGFAGWVISELDKSHDERKINPNFSLGDIASIVHVTKEENTELTKKACQLKEVNPGIIRILIKKLGLFPDSADFVDWAISELDKPKEERKINPNISLLNIASIILGMKKESIESAKKACQLKDVNIEDIKILIAGFEHFPEAAGFADWAISELDKPKEERKINPNFSLLDVALTIWGMNKESAELAKKVCQLKDVNPEDARILINRLGLYPEAIGFADWAISELGKPEEERVNPNITLKYVSDIIRESYI